MHRIMSQPGTYAWAVFLLVYTLAAAGHAQVSSRPLDAPVMGGAPTRWALVVGVDVHDDPAYAPNPLAAQAAQSLRDGLMSLPGSVSQQRLALITGEAATRANILTTLRNMLGQATANDVLLLHFSGFAVKTADGGLVLMAKDSLLADPVYTGLPFVQVMEGIAASLAQKVMITLDTSFAAAAAAAVDRTVQTGRDILLLAATGPNELLPQFTEPRAGPLVYFLREGLSGPADASGNLLITAREAAEYTVRQWGPWLQARNASLTPGIFGGSGQFAIVDMAAVVESALPASERPVPAPPVLAPEIPATSPVSTTPPPDFPMEPPLAPSSVESVPPMPAVTPPLPTAASPVSGQRMAALLIGINTYEAPRLTSLSAPVGDVALMKETLVRAMGAELGRVLTLTEQAATYQGILDAAQRAAQMTAPEDLLLVYYAGHAARVPDPTGDLETGTSYMLCPRDMQMTGQNILPMRVLAEALAKAPARRVVLVLDALNAAAAGMFLTPLANAGKEYVLLAACGADQFSFEMDFPLPDGTSVRQGAFTYYLVQGLHGMADLSRDGRITASEAVEYARLEMDRKGHSQRPELVGMTGGIVLAVTAAGEGALTGAAAAAQALAAAAEAAAAARPPAAPPVVTPQPEEKKPEPPKPDEPKPEPPKETPAPAPAPVATPEQTPAPPISPPPPTEAPKEEIAPPAKEEVKAPAQEAPKEETQEKPKVPAGPPKKWAVLVGINRYASPALPELSGAVNDTKEMRSLLVDAMSFKSAEVTVLNDAKATREAVLGAVRNVGEKAGPNDLVLFYFSGHSAMFSVSSAHGEELVLCSHDARLIEGGISLPFREVMAALAELPVKQRVAVLETSRAAAGAPFVDRAVTQGQSTLLLAGCGPEERTQDARLQVSGKEQLQGAFTYFFSQGLRGEAAKSKSAAKRIPLNDAMDYAAKKLDELGYGQKPRLIGEPADLVLSAPLSAE